MERDINSRSRGVAGFFRRRGVAVLAAQELLIPGGTHQRGDREGLATRTLTVLVAHVDDEVPRPRARVLVVIAVLAGVAAHAGVQPEPLAMVRHAYHDALADGALQLRLIRKAGEPKAGDSIALMGEALVFVRVERRTLGQRHAGEDENDRGHEHVAGDLGHWSPPGNGLRRIKSHGFLEHVAHSLPTEFYL